MNKKGLPATRWGFTLIELLIVISIIGILSTLFLANYNPSRQRARDVARKSDLDEVKKSLRLYYNDYNVYPQSSSEKIRACGNPPTTTFEWGAKFSCGEMVYMNLLPQNNDSNKPYLYLLPDGETYGRGFCLWAVLETTSDTAIARSKTLCPSCATVPDGYNYVACSD